MGLCDGRRRGGGWYGGGMDCLDRFGRGCERGVRGLRGAVRYVSVGLWIFFLFFGCWFRDAGVSIR